MNTGRIFFGLALAALGVVFTLDSAGAVDAGDALARWWPAAVVALGAVQAIETRHLWSGAVVLIGAGLALLGVTTGLFGSDAWSYVWPAALVLVGLWIMFGWARRSGVQPSEQDELDGFAVLGSARLGTRSQRFRRASLTAVLGGITLDLTEATPTTGGADVQVTSILGSVEILVPRGWFVEMRGIPIIGGWDDTTDRTAVGSGSPRLEVHTLVALGGVEVKHSGRWR